VIVRRGYCSGPRRPHQPSGPTGVRQIASRDPFTKGPGSSLTALAGSAAAAEKWPKSLGGSGEGSIEGEAERGLLIGVT
jgi:hypothetical protein